MIIISEIFCYSRRWSIESNSGNGMARAANFIRVIYDLHYCLLNNILFCRYLQTSFNECSYSFSSLDTETMEWKNIKLDLLIDSTWETNELRNLNNNYNWNMIRKLWKEIANRFNSIPKYHANFMGCCNSFENIVWYLVTVQFDKVLIN